MFVLAVVAKVLTAVLGLRTRHGRRTTVAGRAAMRVRETTRKMLAADIGGLWSGESCVVVGVEVVVIFWRRGSTLELGTSSDPLVGFFRSIKTTQHEQYAIRHKLFNFSHFSIERRLWMFISSIGYAFAAKAI